MTFSYDKSSNLTSITNPNGTIVSNSYDSLNRLTARNITKGTDVL
ncbi:MAG: RHS repeat protein [Candidatus Peribacteria bacterium]|nr:RHS repeat protein [Candidatus Peribacteria bacterium]